MQTPHYEVYALRYGTLAARHAHENFLHAPDDHDGPMPLDYFIWLIRGGGRTIVVDTGFGEAGAAARKRQYLCRPVEALGRLGITPETVDDVVLSHMHYDHAGNMGAFGRARFHVQDAEMAFCTGRCMCHEFIRHTMQVDDVLQAVRFLYAGQMRFHDGEGEVAPGITVHRVGGHTPGLQVVRVPTRRGWVVLASDATHFWANIRQRSPFPVVTDVAGMLEGYLKVESLADTPDHIIPGHDPLVLKRFPIVPGATDVVQLHLDPV